MWTLTSFAVVLLCCTQAFCNVEHELAARLLAEYPDPHFIRPVADPGDAVQLSLDYSLVSLVDFDEHAAHLTTWGYLRLSWMDEFLTWDADENGINNLRFDTHDIWNPDVRSYQGMVDEVSEHMGIVFSSGKVLMIPPMKHMIQCEAAEEPRHYTCKFNLGSWAYPQSQVETSLRRNSSGLDTRHFKAHPMWELVEEESGAEVIGRTFSCCPDDIYESLEITLHIRRSEAHRHGHGHDPHGHEDGHSDESHERGKGRPGGGRHPQEV